MPSGPNIVTPDVSAPPREGYTALSDNAGGSAVVYQGRARSVRNDYATLTGATISKANPAVVTFTNHGLDTDNLVVISGATSGWVTINASFIITKIDANTFSIAINSSGFSGTFDGVVKTNAPQTSAPIWSINKIYYSSNSTVRVAWAVGSPTENQIWDNRAILSYQ